MEIQGFLSVITLKKFIKITRIPIYNMIYRYPNRVERMQDDINIKKLFTYTLIL